MLDASIIIVNYNTRDLTIDCIESIKRETVDLEYEIIVVDNNSDDDSVNRIKNNFADVIVISLTENLGFGKANNIGASNATGEYLFLLNSDTKLINNAVGILVKFMRESELSKIGACGGNLYKIDGTPNFSYSLEFPSVKNIFYYRSGLIKLLERETFNFTNYVKEVALIIGADLLIRRDLFDQLEGFDPQFFMYIEDGDLQYRLHKMGYKIYSVPEAKIYHLQGASSNSFSKLKMEIKSYRIYLRKHNNLISFHLFNLIELLSSFFRMIYFAINFNKNKVFMYFKILRFILK
jgi:GT2 family glycosyltransferase